jgi:tRNA U34 5-carboxymethylaminomethyl modifying GTPase MnmE/TrmE
VTKKDGYYLANIEIINDDISKDIELSLTKKKQF